MALPKPGRVPRFITSKYDDTSVTFFNFQTIFVFKNQISSNLPKAYSQDGPNSTSTPSTTASVKDFGP